MRKLFVKGGLVALPIFAMVAFSMCATICFPQYFTKGIYGLLCAQNDYTEKNNDPNRVLVIGDSIGQVSYLPGLLSGDTYNYSFGNETPIDGYYRLREYIQHHGKPEYIFCSYSPNEFLDQSSIWSTTILLHGMRPAVARDMLDDCEALFPNAKFLKENNGMELASYELGVNLKSVKMTLSSLVNNLAGDKTCFENWQEQYVWVQEHRGHWRHHMRGGVGTDVNAALTACQEFSVTDVADHYMNRIAELCEKEGIQFIYETVPFNYGTFSFTGQPFVDSYQSYWDEFAAKHPKAVVNGTISYYDDSYFCDSLHFAENGTRKFSTYIRDKYGYVFEEGGFS